MCRVCSDVTCKECQLRQSTFQGARGSERGSLPPVKQEVWQTCMCLGSHSFARQVAEAGGGEPQRVSSSLVWTYSEERGRDINRTAQQCSPSLQRRKSHRERRCMQTDTSPSSPWPPEATQAKGRTGPRPQSSICSHWEVDFLCSIAVLYMASKRRDLTVPAGRASHLEVPQGRHGAELIYGTGAGITASMRTRRRKCHSSPRPAFPPVSKHCGLGGLLQAQCARPSCPGRASDNTFL